MITILDDGTEFAVAGDVAGGRVRMPVSSLESSLGFVRKPEGLCKDDVCIPVRPGSRLEEDGVIDVTTLAEILGRPVAIDETVGAAYIGAAVDDRANQLRSLEAPDFTLPDLDGTTHSLAQHRGKKVILVAYASW